MSTRFGGPRELADRRGAFGLVERRMRWGLTWRAWALMLLVAVAAVFLTIRYLYDFLAICQVVPGDAMVVEGWLPDTEVASVRQAFFVGHYRHIYLTGGPLLKSDPMHRYMTYPDLMLIQLLDMGFTADQLTAVPAPLSERDRTYASAIALREWFDRHGGPVPAVNIVTTGAHARRSRMLFKLALGDRVKVGVIPVTSRDFNPQRWWTSSDGVKTVLTEGIAYLYARFIFRG